MNQDNDFYVYQHKEADTGRVFYVGRGRGKRWKERSKSKRSEWWHRIVNSHGGFIAEKIYEDLTNDQANYLEVMLISAYGRENLCNLTNGGDGAPGMSHSDEHKEYMREIMTGRYITPEWRDKISVSKTGEKNFNWGKKHPDHVIKNMQRHGANPSVFTFTHKDYGIFTGSVNDWMHEFSMLSSDAKNMSRHANTGRYTHVKGWQVING